MFSSPVHYQPKSTFYNQKSSEQTRIGFTQDRGVLYKIDGSGRDTYIFNDNGGFAVPYLPTQYQKSGYLPNVNKYKSQLGPKRPYLHSRSVYYRSDGTGRDNYIVMGNGGFGNTTNLQEYRQAFKNSLRKYDKRNNSQTFQRSLFNKKTDNLCNQAANVYQNRIQSNYNKLINSNFQSNQNQQNIMLNYQTPEKYQEQKIWSRNVGTRGQIKDQLQFLLQDNPNYFMRTTLKNYQDFLDKRLSQPKYFTQSKSQGDFNQLKAKSQMKQPKMQKIKPEEKQNLFKRYLENSQNKFNKTQKVSNLLQQNQIKTSHLN